MKETLKVHWKGKEIILPETTVQFRVNRLGGKEYNYDQNGIFLQRRAYLGTELRPPIKAFGPIEVCGINFVLVRRHDMPEAERGPLNKGFRIAEPLTGSKISPDTVTAEECLQNAEETICAFGALHTKEIIRETVEAHQHGVQVQLIEAIRHGWL